jgi:hypothetical protein
VASSIHSLGASGEGESKHEKNADFGPEIEGDSGKI